jgi:hypothetical protein
MKLPDFSELLAFEKAHFTSGAVPSSATPAALAYRAEVVDYDARRCEAISLTEDLPPLQRARGHIFRGAYAEAERELDALAGAARSDGRLAAEALLERARIRNFRAQWGEAIRLVDEALAGTPAPTSLPALYQMRANARYELGELGPASQDLDKVASLSQIFPHAISNFYAETYRVRLRARDAGPASARRLIRGLWESGARGRKLTPEMAAALLRLEIDCARLEGAEHARLAVACHALEDLMGDALFTGIAVLDFCHALPPTRRGALEIRCAELARHHPRIQALREELAGHAPPSTTARAMRGFRAPDADDGAEAPLIDQAWEGIHLPAQGLFLRLRPWATLDLSRRRQFSSVLLAAHAREDRETLFHRLWGELRYAPERHDPLIYALVSKTKRTLGVELGFRNGRLTAGGVLPV